MFHHFAFAQARVQLLLTMSWLTETSVGLARVQW